MTAPRPGRARRVASLVLRTTACTALFAGASTLGLLMHANHPAARRVTAELVNRALAGTFRGTLTVDAIGLVALRRGAVAGVDVVVRDAEGHVVVRARGVHARVAPLPLLRSLFGSGPLDVRITAVSVDDAEITLRTDASGASSLAQAFQPRTAALPGAPPTPTPSVALSAITVAHAWAHGEVAGEPLDVDLDGFAGALSVNDASLDATIERAALRARSRRVASGSGRAAVTGVVSLPMGATGRPSGRATVAVIVGRTSVMGEATYLDGRLDAHVAIPSTAPSGLADVVVGLPIHAPIAADVRAHGPLDALDVDARVDLGAGHASLAARASLGAVLRARVDVQVTDTALRDLEPGAPAGVVSGHLVANGSSDDAGLRASYALDTEPTVLDGNAVPRAATRGEVGWTDRGLFVKGEANAEEPGAAVVVGYALSPEPQTSDLGLDLDVGISGRDLGRSTRVSGYRGALDARATGHLTLGETTTFRAKLRATATALRGPGFSVGSAAIEAMAHGELARPVVSAGVLATRIRAGGLALSRLNVTAEGPARAPAVVVGAYAPGGDRLRAAGQLSFATGVTARQVDVQAVRNGESIHALARRARVDGSGISIEGLVVELAGGSVRGDAQLRGGAVEARLASSELDLARIGTLVGGAAAGVRGSASLAVEASAATRRRSLRVVVRDLYAPGPVEGASIERAQASFEGILDDRTLRARAFVGIPDVGTVALWTGDVRLGGDPFSAASYRTATGTIDVSGAIDLARASALVPAASVPVSSVTGAATFTLHADRATTSGLPDVSAGVVTTGLSMETRGPDGPGARIAGMDVAIHAALSSRDGRAVADAFVTDEHGEVVEAHLTAYPGTPLDPRDPALARTLQNIPPGPPKAARGWQSIPFELGVFAPPRRLARLPASIRNSAADGEVTARLHAKGTLRSLSAEVSLRATDVTVTGEGRKAPPLDVSVVASLAAGRVGLDGTVAAAGRPMLVTRVAGTVAVEDLLDGREEPGWSGDADLALSGMPLRFFTPLLGRSLPGCISGTVALRGLHDDARADAKLRIDGLRLGGVAIEEATLDARMKDGTADLAMKVVEGDGDVVASGSLGLAWGKALTPSLDMRREAALSLEARSFRIAPLQAFVRESLGRVDGLLDGTMRLHVTPSHPDGGVLEGSLRLRDGVADVAVLGQEMRAIDATLTASSGELRLHDASLRGVTGRAVVEASAHLRGFELLDAKASVRIARKEAMALTYEGVDLGEAWGDVDLAAASTESGVVVRIGVPSFSLELPDVAAHDTQSLEAEPTVRAVVATRRGVVVVPLSGTPPGTPAESTGQPGTTRAARPKLQVRVTLGPEVRVHRTNSLDAWLRGEIAAEVSAGPPAVSGTVSVTRGFVELQGRRFVIDHATASFDPARPAADPTVQATAIYEAPDATRIFADFTGTAEKGKLRLRSEPMLTQAEILSLVVFGSREVGGGAGSNRATGAAAGVGGGVATQGLNKVLSNVSPVEITTRVDTSSAQDPRPEVGVALSRKVSVRGSYGLGQPIPGQTPDRSILHFDYRFLPHWSLETSFGDKGTSIVDVIWRLRY